MKTNTYVHVQVCIHVHGTGSEFSGLLTHVYSPVCGLLLNEGGAQNREGQSPPRLSYIVSDSDMAG